MAAELLHTLRQKFFDSNGEPLAGGKLYSYAAGTTTPQVTYTDQGGGTPNANPTILDANGEADIWIGTGSYKFVLKDADDVTQWTVDNVQSLRALIADTVNEEGALAVTNNLSDLDDVATALTNLGIASATMTFTNKTIDAEGTGNAISNIKNSNIKAAAAIALDKLAATTASRALVSDSSGFVSPATTTSTEIGYLNGVTSSIQTQLDAKIAKSLLTAKGTLIGASAASTPGELAAGTNGYVLTADSTEPLGFKWSAASGGGGGGALRWIEGGNAPTLVFENEIEAYEYQPGLGQALYLAIRVPASYTAGNQIRLRILWTCASTANDALINAVSTLIRSENDAISSTTNQRTTTNAAITMAAGSANEPQKVILDLTDSSGEINAVAVSAGDLIKVKVQESSSTVADNIKLIFDASEVTFT